MEISIKNNAPLISPCEVYCGWVVDVNTRPPVYSQTQTADWAAGQAASLGKFPQDIPTLTLSRLSDGYTVPVAS